MAANRLTRDAIILAALDAVDSPSLDNKERPAGTVASGLGLGIGWLQRALDYFYKVFPIKGTFKFSAISITTSGLVTLPTDFLVDYLNGLVLDNDLGRLTRRGLSYLLSLPTLTKGQPACYAIFNDTQLTFRPLPDKTYPARLWYYSLPAVLVESSIPVFPDDDILVDFLEIRYKEWLGAAPKGASKEYLMKMVAILQRAGIGPEAEPDQIEIDRRYYGGDADPFQDPSGWMGKVTP